MKNIFILHLFFCLFVGVFQLEGANSKALGLFDTGTCPGQETSLCIDSIGFILVETILDEISEDVDTELGVLRKKSELHIFQVQHFLTLGYRFNGPIRLALLQHYTNLPPPTTK